MESDSVKHQKEPQLGNSMPKPVANQPRPQETTKPSSVELVKAESESKELQKVSEPEKAPLLDPLEGRTAPKAQSLLPAATKTPPIEPVKIKTESKERPEIQGAAESSESAPRLEPVAGKPLKAQEAEPIKTVPTSQTPPVQPELPQSGEHESPLSKSNARTSTAKEETGSGHGGKQSSRVKSSSTDTSPHPQGLRPLDEGSPFCIMSLDELAQLTPLLKHDNLEDNVAFKRDVNTLTLGLHSDRRKFINVKLARVRGSTELRFMDGYRRFNGALKLGTILYAIAMIFEFDSWADAEEFALRINHVRRHLDNAQLLLAIDKRWDMEVKRAAGRRRGGARIDDEKQKGSTAEMTARMLGISKVTVIRMRAISRSGNQELIEAFRSGKISISAAYARIHQPQGEEPSADNDEGERKGDTSIGTTQQDNLPKRNDIRKLSISLIAELFELLYHGELDQFQRTAMAHELDSAIPSDLKNTKHSEK